MELALHGLHLLELSIVRLLLQEHTLRDGFGQT